MRDLVGGTKRKASFVGSHFMAICLALLIAVLALALLSNCGGSSNDSTADQSRTYQRTSSSAPASASKSPTASDGLGTIDQADLPPQARTTIALIDAGGPFPYPRSDGSTFANREKLLPAQPRGYYKEYTVKTPGESDRGPRRIVQGKNKTMYYTADHYKSFRRILR